MIIGGLQKFSLLDYPEKISAIVFTQGCNFRCRFCYNPMLVWPVKPADARALAGEGDKVIYARGKTPGQQKAHPIISQDELFVFLKSRRGKLDAVVITGGEPCQQKDLPEFIRKIKDLGLLVKLDTNGSNPQMLKKLIEGKAIDYIAMDIKARPEKYLEVIGGKAELDKNDPAKSSRQAERILPAEKLFAEVEKSVKIVMDSGLPYEFRTTIVPELISKDDIIEIGKIIRGARLWYLQNFKSQTELVDPALRGIVPYNARQMNEMAEIARKYVKKCEVR